MRPSLLFLFITFLFLSPTTSFLGLPLLTCDLSCLTCSGPNADQCTTCLSGLLIIGGACACPDGKYYQSALTACQNCNSACATCNGGAASNCLSCPSNYQLYQTSCYAACTSSQYFDTTALTCVNCNTYCKTCSGSASNQCLTCQTATLTSGTCVCPTGYYVIAQGGCSACDPTCKGCTGSAANQCTACYTGMLLQSNRCVCPSGSYQTTSPVGCQTCNARCLGCSGPTSSDCTSCRSGFEFSSGQCNCPTGTFYDSSSNSCVACYSYCSSCTGAAYNQCTACKNNLNIASNQCSCLPGSYLDTSTITCRTCNSNCDTCSGPTSSDCLSCSGSLSLASAAPSNCICSGTCSCPAGKYFDSGSSTCLPCNPICAECLGGASNECTVCLSGYTGPSPPGGGSCSCSSSCTCTDGYYYNAGTCSPCYSTCATCDGPNANNCLSCNNLLLWSSTAHTCGCSDGYYLDYSSNFCLLCHSTCQTCSGPANTDCIDCKSGLPSSPSGQVCTCPLRKYMDYTSGNCFDCNSNCRTCEGPENDQCLSCDSGKTLDDKMCIDDCTSSQYRAADHSCQPCDSTCLTCEGGASNQCLSCSLPRSFDNKSCVETASNGCHYTCQTCRSSSSSDCLTCTGSLVLFEVAYSYGSCLAQCPVGYYGITEDSQVKCRPRIKLNNTLEYGDDFNQIQIDFKKDIRPFLKELMNAISISIEFRVDQPSINYTYSLDLTGSSKSLMLTLNFYGHLLPKNNLRIAYNLPTVDSPDNKSTLYVVNKLHVIRLKEYINDNPGMSSVASVISNANSIAMQANQVFSWTSSIVLRSVHALRSEIVEDMIGYFIFMNIDYTPNFIQFANDGLNSFEIIMPNLFAPIMDEDEGEDQEYSRILSEDQILEPSEKISGWRMLQQSSRRRFIRNKYRMMLSEDAETILDMRLDSRQFLSNHGAATSLLLISFGIIMVIDVIRHVFAKSTNKFKRLQNFIRDTSCSFRWNFAVSHFTSEYQGFVFFSLVQLVNEVKPLHEKDFLTFIFGILSFLLSSIAVLAAFLVARRANMKLKALKDAKGNEKEAIETDLKRIGLFYKSFKEDSFIQLLYPGLMLTRCFGFGIVLVFLTDWPFIQICYLLLTTVGIIGYLFYIKPLKEKSQNTLTIVYEFFFLTISVLILTLHIYNGVNIEDVNTRTWICFVILTIATSMIVLNMISFVIELFEFRKLLRRKKQVAPLKTNKPKEIDTKQPPKSIANNNSFRTATNVSIPFMGSDAEDQPIKGIRKDLHSMYIPTKKLKARRDSSDEDNTTMNDKQDSVLDTKTSKKKPEAPSTLSRLTEEYARFKKPSSSKILESEGSGSENVLLSKFKTKGVQGQKVVSPKRNSESRKFDYNFQKLDSQGSSFNVSPSKQATFDVVPGSQNLDNRQRMPVMSRNQMPTMMFEDLGKAAPKNGFVTLFELEAAESAANTLRPERKSARLNNSFQGLRPPDRSQDDMKPQSLVLPDNDVSRVGRSADRNRLGMPGSESMLQDVVSVPRKMVHVKNDH